MLLASVLGALEGFKARSFFFADLFPSCTQQEYELRKVRENPSKLVKPMDKKCCVPHTAVQGRQAAAADQVYPKQTRQHLPSGRFTLALPTPKHTKCAFVETPRRHSVAFKLRP